MLVLTSIAVISYKNEFDLQNQKPTEAFQFDYEKFEENRKEFAIVLAKTMENKASLI
jgi:hypothetical protein